MKLIDFSQYRDQVRAAISQQVEDKLNQKDPADSFTLKFDIKDILKEKKLPILAFTSDAYVKIMYMVQSYNSEVAAHAVTNKRRLTDGTPVYIVKDILIYPQMVTGATVTSDDAKYGLWMAGLPDEVFNNLRGQLHSHVTMGVTPSGVDTNYYKELLEQVEDYYVFMIFNKNRADHCIIYDIEDNVMYEDKDIHREYLLANESPLIGWMKEEGKHVEDAPVRAQVVPPTTAAAHPTKTTYYPTNMQAAYERESAVTPHYVPQHFDEALGRWVELIGT